MKIIANIIFFILLILPPSQVFSEPTPTEVCSD